VTSLEPQSRRRYSTQKEATVNSPQTIPTKLDLSRRVGRTTSVEIEYFCRKCKGHYSRIVPIKAFESTRCRCGSSNLLIYSLAADVTAPLRAS
jgi:hypothetical protein